MKLKEFSRRDFLKGSLSTLALASVPGRHAFGQTTIGTRLEWNDFKTTSAYGSYMNAIAAMRANTNASDRRSWIYWSNIHQSSCPHGIPYFLAWHRGYLHTFQETVREVSGNSSLVVPYWDYYKNANLPSEFTDPASPLYVTGRVNSNVASALSLIPFAARYKNFQRGLTDAFETAVEYRPHGSFHNIIGGYMAKLNSPMDPVFWFHHGQIDRLWAAWVAAGGGRQMPPITDAYWSGNYTYASSTLPRNRAYDTQTYLRYTYTDLRLPTSLPPSAQLGKIVRVQATPSGSNSRRPPTGLFTNVPPQTVGNRRVVGGVQGIVLDEKSVSALIPLDPQDSKSVEAIADISADMPSNARGAGSVKRYKSLKVALTGTRVTPSGSMGGFYYEVYLNLPDGSDSLDEQYLIGTFGPFEVDSAQQHGGQLIFPATRALQRASRKQLTHLTVSFVRVNGQNSPSGPALVIHELRGELSDDAVE